MKTRGSAVLVLVAFALALAGAAYVVVNPPSEAQSTYRSHYTPPAEQPTPTNVLAFGDSYTAGTGASTPAGAWVQLVADHEGWSLTDLASGGTGYLQTSGKAGCGLAHCPNYSQALRAATDYAPDMVIVAGGRNDLALPPAQVHAAVDAFFTRLARQFPHADLVAVSPWWDATKPPAALATEATWVRAAVERAGGTYLDTGQPLEGKPNLVIADKIHPNDAGHAALAQAVETALG